MTPLIIPKYVQGNHSVCFGCEKPLGGSMRAVQFEVSRKHYVWVHASAPGKTGKAPYVTKINANKSCLSKTLLRLAWLNVCPVCGGSPHHDPDSNLYRLPHRRVCAQCEEALQNLASDQKDVEMAREELKKSESEAEQRYFRVCVRSVLKDWILDLGDTSESILEAARKEIQRRVDEAHSEGFRKGRNMLQALARGEVTLSSLLDPAVRNKGG